MAGTPGLLHRSWRIIGVLLAVASLAPFAPGAAASALPRPTIGVPSGASQFVALAPSRLADTRPSEGALNFERISANIIRVQVAGRFGAPLNASAAVLNIVAVNASGPGFVSVFPAGFALPLASSLNIDAPGRVIANMVTVKLNAGAVDIYALNPMDLVVDLSGVYVPVDEAPADGRLVTLASGAARMLDTRESSGRIPGGATLRVEVAASGIPANASAVVVNITAIDAAVGYYTAYPVGQNKPGTSSLNLDRNGQIQPGQAIVQIANGNLAINVFTLNGGHLAVDVAGWFTGAGVTPAVEGLFVPADPVRLLDTRDFMPLPPWKNSTFTFDTKRGSSGVSGVALNITGVDPWAPGFLTAYPAGSPRPNTSNLNLTSFGQVVANHAIVRVGLDASQPAPNNKLAIFTLSGSHIVVDLAGWYLGTPSPYSTPKPPNLVLQPNRAVAVYVPGLDKFLPVEAGEDLDYIADRGRVAAFGDQVHVAAAGNIMLFGHRTKISAGRPFYYINLLGPGETFVVYGEDGHAYTYLVMRNDITRPAYSTIQSIATSVAPLTAQLIACHPLGSISQRVVVTGRLISVD